MVRYCISVRPKSRITHGLAVNLKLKPESGVLFDWKMFERSDDRSFFSQQFREPAENGPWRAKQKCFDANVEVLKYLLLIRLPQSTCNRSIGI